MIARLAIVRVVPKLAMAFPRINLAAPVTQPTVKPLSEQQLRGRRPASYNSLKKGLTALLDRTAARPYFGRAISTPKASLPRDVGFFGA
jgi:hypothetical protein